MSGSGGCYQDFLLTESNTTTARYTPQSRRVIEVGAKKIAGSRGRSCCRLIPTGRVSGAEIPGIKTYYNRPYSTYICWLFFHYFLNKSINMALKRKRKTFIEFSSDPPVPDDAVGPAEHPTPKRIRVKQMRLDGKSLEDIKEAIGV